MSQQSLWIILLAFGVSAASWVIGQLRDQSRRKRARDEAQRRYEEHLRTGRSVEEQPQAPAVSRAQELAERRQAQLRELRRQQEASRGVPATVVVARQSSAQPTAPRGVRPTGLPPGVVVERIPAPAGGRKPSGPPHAAPPRRIVVDPRAEAERRRLAERTERMRLARQAELAAQAEEESLRRRRAALASRPAASEPPSPALRAPMIMPLGASRHELRRMIVAMEVLGPPLALRE